MYIFIQENAFDNVVCEMTATFSWRQCVERMLISDFDGCLNTDYSYMFFDVYYNFGMTWVICNTITGVWKEISTTGVKVFIVTEIIFVTTS